MEFGSRRAQGYDGAIFGSRAAYIGGCVGTACTISERDYGIPALGTMAHSWVQMFPTELDAFRDLRRAPGRTSARFWWIPIMFSNPAYPTRFRYSTRRSCRGACARRAFASTAAISTYLSKKARQMLDEAGFRGLPDHRLQRAGRIHHPRHFDAGRPDRFLRRRRAADHLPV